MLPSGHNADQRLSHPPAPKVRMNPCSTLFDSLLSDPQLARALSAIHERPGDRWTVDSLARIAGMSRSGFAQRFAEACGEPAIAYLGRWRMMLATERLSQGEPIGAVAQNLGYGSESAFGTAFRRIMGVSPGNFRPR